jgi:hypothetical protein
MGPLLILGAILTQVVSIQTISDRCGGSVVSLVDALRAKRASPVVPQKKASPKDYRGILLFG